MCYVQFSEGGFQVVYPLVLWFRFSGAVKFPFGCGRYITSIT